MPDARLVAPNSFQLTPNWRRSQVRSKQGTEGLLQLALGAACHQACRRTKECVHAVLMPSFVSGVCESVWEGPTAGGATHRDR